MMGIINALKTGDPTMDMIIAMCIPVVLRVVFKFAERWEALLDLEGWIRAMFRPKPKSKYERHIEYKRSRNAHGGTISLDSDTQNPVLLKAIQLYVHYNCQLELLSADLDLTSVDSNNNNQGGNNNDGYYYDDYYDDYGNSSRDNDTTTFAGMLSKYEIVKKQPLNVWHSLGEFGSPAFDVQLCISEQEQTDSSGTSTSKEVSTVYHFMSEGADAIDDFIDKAYKWYLNELRQMEDNSRHYYELKSVEEDTHNYGRNNNNNSGFLYTRYKLSDEKTFESLFFRQKEALLKAVGHFQSKTGKYSIKGYPHKLGLLLHGPAGTGKTSLIKALAHHTGRSIVNVSLSKITTNSELMSIFFDRKFRIQGEMVPVQLGFKDVIFVIEDVDAASKIVKRRGGSRRVATTESDFVNVPPPKSMWRMLLESNEADCLELVELLMEQSERLKEEATKPEVLRSISKRMATVPGLSFVGEGKDGDAVHTIGTEAVESAQTLMHAYSTVDRFVSFHAKTIKARLDAGAEVDDDFVDELLGTSIPSSPNEWIVPAASSSSSTFDDDDGYVEEKKDDDSSVDSEKMLVKVAKMFESETKKSSTNKGDESPHKSTSAWEGIGPSLWTKTEKDQLNLAGLLNVLDGVVDTPGRILIMTTNHPEHLDPALIRPGRIDKKILLSYMEAEDVIEMLNHYFQDEELTDSHRQRVMVAINDNGSQTRLNLTPAQVEMLCAEHDFIEDMIQKLEEKRR